MEANIKEDSNMSEKSDADMDEDCSTSKKQDSNMSLDKTSDMDVICEMTNETITKVSNMIEDTNVAVDFNVVKDSDVVEDSSAAEGLVVNKNSATVDSNTAKFSDVDDLGTNKDTSTIKDPPQTEYSDHKEDVGIFIKKEEIDVSDEKMSESVKEEIDAKDVQKMEIGDAPAVENSILKKEEDAINIQVIQKNGELVHLSVEGVEEDDEETIIMTPEEVRAYLQQKIEEHLRDPKVNQLLELNTQAEKLREEIVVKNEEYIKLHRMYEVIYRNQEKFLRHMGVLPKVAMSSVSISVDMPQLPLPPPTPSTPPESVLRKDLNTSRAGVLPPGSKLQQSPVPGISTSTVSTPGGSENVAPVASNQRIECIDLTDEMEPAPAANTISLLASLTMIKHPAPLPPRPFSVPNKLLPNVPPKPRLKVTAEDRGIILQWDMPPNVSPGYGKLSAFDIFGYQEMKGVRINTLLWKKIGSVRAMSLPMACTLTQFVEQNKYHFTIRAVDVHNRCGSYSDPISVTYSQTKNAA